MDEGRQRGTIPAWPESACTRDRGSRTCRRHLLSPSRGTSPATGLLADRRSRTWLSRGRLGPRRLRTRVQGRAGRFGPLLTAAGFAWFLPEWNNPAIDSSLAFTIGLCLYAACPPLVAHAVLAYPSGRLGSHTERGVASLTWAACSSSASCPPLCTTGKREDAISVRATS